MSKQISLFRIIFRFPIIRTKNTLSTRCRIVSLLVAWFVWAGGVPGAFCEPANFPSLLSSLEAIGPLDFCGERVPLEIQEVRERLEKETLLSVWNRPQVILWLKRSRRYLPHIEEMLRDRKMPDDLKFVAVVESAFLPHARSAKGAVGFWQFLPDTGRKYGLVINRQIDERRNLFASTRAALQYLKELHSTFGSWTLAVAGYNMGEDGLSAEILEQESNDYYNLYLPLETQRFLFRILSVKLIISAPEEFGFKIMEEQYYPPITFDEVRIDCTEKIPIRIIAQAARNHFKVVKDLNPEIRGHYLPSGNHDILIPNGAAEGFQERFRRLMKDFLAELRGRIYVIEKGDSLSLIAGKFNIPLSALIIWNDLDPRSPIYPGNELIICTEDTKPCVADITTKRIPEGPERRQPLVLEKQQISTEVDGLLDPYAIIPF
ncbi:MAG: transglycosylase SLT domain-containing protein [Desulfobacterales bacterium]|nr:MAG: transglycosylase SLT domain-containing protein [Desulfobacterales bacterium]